MMDWHHLLHHFEMSERLDLADAACPARFQPNFLRAAKPKAKTALKTLDWKQGTRPLLGALIIGGEWRYSAGGHHSVTDPPEYRVSRF